jgi:UDP-N-acetylglucosamine acyltransferase
LRRRGFSPDDILTVRRAYKTLYRENLPLEEARAKIAQEATSAPALVPLAEFLTVQGRGIVR